MSLPVDTDLRQAKSYLKTGKVAEAKALYEKVLLKFPKKQTRVRRPEAGHSHTKPRICNTTDAATKSSRGFG